MRGILGFIKRNVLLFFKDWQSILFSLLTSIIVLVLYLLFLKGTFVSAIQSAKNILLFIKLNIFLSKIINFRNFNS